MADQVRSEELNEAPRWKTHEQAWPPAVRPVVGIDGRGILYWDGKPVQSRQLVLTRGQKILAVLVALAVIAGGLGCFVQGFLTYHDWACREGLPTVPCHMGQIDDNAGQ